MDSYPKRSLLYSGIPQMLFSFGLLGSAIARPDWWGIASTDSPIPESARKLPIQALPIRHPLALVKQKETVAPLPLVATKEALFSKAGDTSEARVEAYDKVKDKTECVGCSELVNRLPDHGSEGGGGYFTHYGAWSFADDTNNCQDFSSISSAVLRQFTSGVGPCAHQAQLVLVGANDVTVQELIQYKNGAYLGLQLLLNITAGRWSQADIELLALQGNALTPEGAFFMYTALANYRSSSLQFFYMKLSDSDRENIDTYLKTGKCSNDLITFERDNGETHFCQ